VLRRLAGQRWSRAASAGSDAHAERRNVKQGGDGD
jgi:hypothetical protein